MESEALRLVKLFSAALRHPPWVPPALRSQLVAQ